MLKIGDFARIAQVSIRQLRHYDKIGLLKPLRVDPESSYRFYTVSQLPRLNRIIALKDLGFTLEQIAQALEDNVTGEEIQGMLNLRRAQIEQTLQDEIARLRRVEMRLYQIAEEGRQSVQDVIIKSVPPLQMLAASKNISDAEGGQLLLSNMTTLAQRNSGLGSFVILLPEIGVQDEIPDIEYGFLVEDELRHSLVLSNNLQLTLRPLPAVGTMATTLYVGNRPDCLMHVALGKWIEANQYELLGSGRYVFLQFGSADNGYETVIEVQLPVQKMSIELDI